MWYIIGSYDKEGYKKELAIAHSKEEVKKYYDRLKCATNSNIWVEEVRSVDVEHEL